MISYSPDQVDFILERFVTHGDTPQAHSQTWCRRLYAPMYIFEPELADVRRRLEDAYPEHVIAFDIVFQSRGNATDWHTDYESLGPFIVRDAFAAMTASHFVSIHANLTKEGGHLLTCHRPIFLSWLHYWAIVFTGIYSWLHACLVAVCRPYFYMAAYSHPNVVGAGNAFNNMRLHAVSSGAPRTSYVVRLVHKDVILSREAVRKGMSRSAVCSVFEFLMDWLPDEGEHRVGTLKWGTDRLRDRD